MVDKLEMAEFWFEVDDGTEDHWLKRLAKRRGVMATKKIKKGEVVLSIPFELVVSVEAAEKTELKQERHSLNTSPLNPDPETLNPAPQTLSPKPLTPDCRPQTLNLPCFIARILHF